METEGKSNELTIDCAPSGRKGTATLTVRLGSEVLAVESLNLTKPRARTDFIARLSERRPGIEAEKLEARLLELAADAVAKPERASTPEAGVLPELDTSSIVRPERFITPEVSGLAVSTMAVVGDQPVRRWLRYLRWREGRRESAPVAPYIDLPEGRRLWIHPAPPDPTPSTSTGWSIDARRKWLQGAPAPNPGEVFQALAERFAHYLDLSKESGPGVVATLPLWVLLTYCYQAWDAVPYLYIGGPVGSGKSRVLEILSRLVFRPLSSSNMTSAALFRTLHSQGGTLLLDEAERLRQTQDPATGEIMSMLLAGYKRGGQATRLEPVGDTYKTVSFDVYGPKALACVTGLPPALASRSIPITMFRAAPTSEKPRLRIDANPAGWQSLRDDLHALALEHGPTWLDLPGQADVCPVMAGRDYELWQPLLSLASWLDPHGSEGLLGLLQEHALRVIDSGKDETTPDHDEVLLRVLAETLRSGITPQPGEILAEVQNKDPLSFKTWTAKAVSSHLKRYGIETYKSHGHKRYGGATLDKMEAVQRNYGIDLGFDDAAAAA